MILCDTPYVELKTGRFVGGMRLYARVIGEAWHEGHAMTRLREIEFKRRIFYFTHTVSQSAISRTQNSA